MTSYRWARWGDVNAFFGLMLDNVAVLVVLITMIATPAAGELHFTPRFVIERMIPGTALGVLIGDLVYTWLAFRLAKRTGRDDITAMPLGLDTPSTFAVGLLVLLPTLRIGMERFQDHDQAMVFAWHVGAAALVMVGLFKSLVSPFGNAVRRWVPRAGLLGSLAAVALALISFLPLLHIAPMPIVGMLALTVILITLVAHRPLPGNVPGALAAVVIGTVLYYVLLGLGDVLGLAMVPAPEGIKIASTPAPLPDVATGWAWWEAVLLQALERLPLVVPFALATIVGGIDCTESAAVAGDEYDTRTILLTEGLATVAAGLAGGVIQNTPYIGQPAYKAMGGRAAYTLATGIFIGLMGWFGWVTVVFTVVPPAVLYPILVFVGLEITAQSFRATPQAHYPALAFAALPLLAYLGLILVVPLNLQSEASPTVQTLRCLGHGFIVTSLLWGAALAALLDGKLYGSAGYLLIAAAASLVGIIHSPLKDEKLAWPWLVMAELPESAKYQTPYHWAAAYVVAAVLLAAMHWFASRGGVPDEGEASGGRQPPEGQHATEG